MRKAADEQLCSQACRFAVITLFSVLTIVFFIVRILPGDPALVILGDQASMEAIEALRARLGSIAR